VKVVNHLLLGFPVLNFAFPVAISNRMTGNDCGAQRHLNLA
jgi:hypothetical protein